MLEQMAWLYERDIQPGFALAIEGYRDLEWFYEEIDQIYLRRKADKNLTMASSIYHSVAGVMGKRKGHSAYKAWIQSIKNSLKVRLGQKIETMFEFLQRTRGS